MHLAGILAILCATPLSLNTSIASGPVEVKFVENKKSLYLNATPSKLLKSRPGENRRKKSTKGDEKITQGSVNTPPVKLQDYADQLKSVVDPVWYAKVKSILPEVNTYFETNVLIFLDRDGNIVSVKIIKSSGNETFDNVATDTLKQISKLPKPPESLIKEGIIWSFSTL